MSDAHHEQTGFLPGMDSEREDHQTWMLAMNAYHHARAIGLPRSEAFDALKPLLEHPRLSAAAQIMRDIVSRYPE